MRSSALCDKQARSYEEAQATVSLLAMSVSDLCWCAPSAYDASEPVRHVITIVAYDLQMLMLPDTTLLSTKAHQTYTAMVVRKAMVWRQYSVRLLTHMAAAGIQVIFQ